MATNLGKQAEQRIYTWLNRPADGFDMHRLPDQVSGFYGSKNPSDFILYKYPYQAYIESKATYEDRFSFDMLSDFQHASLADKNRIRGVCGFVIVLFASYKRAFIINIAEIDKLIEQGKKSINIKKLWNFKFYEIRTIPNNRKTLLDYDTSDTSIIEAMSEKDDLYTKE